MAEHQFDDSYDGRIASLETNQVRFHEDLQRLTRSFSDFDTRMGQKFDQMLQNQNDNQKTPWTNILSAAGVLLAVLVTIGSMNNSFVMSSIGNNSSNIIEQAGTLQREMQLLNTGQTQTVARNLLLIEKLEDEIDRLREHQNPTPHTHKGD